VHNSPTVLDYAYSELTVRRKKVEVRAAYCLPPAYQGSEDIAKYPPYLLFTHADRARLSPMNGCSMACQFCNIPFEKPMPKYELFSPAMCVEALRIAVDDPIQPARHIMISGGTPRPTDAEQQRELYRQVLHTFPEIDVDIMMVPEPGLLDVEELKHEGVNELSINLEVYDEERAKQVAPQKYRYGRGYYIDFIEQAVSILGRGRVRSMLLVGMEPLKSTLEGVRAIAERGALPVLSPFRPDPTTPLRDVPPPSYELMREAYLRGQEIALSYDTALGPICPPCTHNTLGFAEGFSEGISYRYQAPAMLATPNSIFLNSLQLD
jgi:radical SAM superfamily enzyme YgiQ (UPF0313 family)